MVSKKQITEEIILCMIKQEFADVKRYENSFPIPSIDYWQVPILDRLIETAGGSQ